MKDALGNDVVIGEYYGYSQNKNGLTNIKVGELMKINEKSVTLRVTYFKTALYIDNPSEPTFPLGKDTISVKANMLFPVDKSKIN